jgi:hypothetical protein
LHLDCNGYIEDDVKQNNEQKETWKKVKNQDSMGQTNFLLCTLPFIPYALLATWVHVAGPPKIWEK